MSKVPSVPSAAPKSRIVPYRACGATPLLITYPAAPPTAPGTAASQQHQHQGAANGNGGMNDSGTTAAATTTATRLLTTGRSLQPGAAHAALQPPDRTPPPPAPSPIPITPCWMSCGPSSRVGSRPGTSQPRPRALVYQVAAPLASTVLRYHLSGRAGGPTCGSLHFGGAGAAAVGMGQPQAFPYGCSHNVMGSGSRPRSAHCNTAATADPTALTSPGAERLPTYGIRAKACGGSAQSRARTQSSAERKKLLERPWPPPDPRRAGASVFGPEYDAMAMGVQGAGAGSGSSGSSGGGAQPPAAEAVSFRPQSAAISSIRYK